MSTSTSVDGCCSSITGAPLTSNDAEQLATRIKALGDPARLQLLNMISLQGEMCVCDMTDPLGLSQPTVSHHLKVLSDAGFVRREQRGKWAYFSLEGDELQHMAHSLFTAG